MEPKDRAAQPRITLKDVLRAIFLPERDADAPALPALPRPARWPILRRPLPSAPPPDADALLAPAQVDYTPQPLQTLERASLLRMATLVAGTCAVLLIAYAAQRMAADGTAGPGVTLLYALAILGWLALLLFRFVPPDLSLLCRGPRITGSAGYTLPPLLLIEPLSARSVAILLAIPLSVVTYILTADNTFTAGGVLAWVLSVAAWMIAAAERSPADLLSAARAWLRQVRSWTPHIERRHVLPLTLFLLIMGIAAFFRFYRLDAMPNEMTSDHVEKLLDAYDVSQGVFHVFFTRNGGREAIQFYLVALASRVFGTGMSFLTLKLVAAVEGLLLIPLMIWFGRELVDRETGYAAAALVAISWWHVVLSRLSLRIVLTPLVFTLILILLVRGIRTGARRAWLWAGFWMGVGLYSYQALRITPLVAIAAFLIAIAGPLARAAVSAWQGRDDAALRRLLADNAVSRQALNLALTGLVALAVSVPMLRVWHDYPDELWNRVINRTTSAETAIQGEPVQVFADNYRRALQMFNVRGDVAWVSAVPGAPVMDVIPAALFVLGLAAWSVRLFVRRDPADAFILSAALIMLLPSALALAFPIENPSTTRASGTLPIVFLLAAWPLSLIAARWRIVLGRVRGALLAALLVAILLGAAAQQGFTSVFDRYATSYRNAALNPGEVAQAVREVISPDAPLDGVWLQGWPYWHDYRAIGIEAGDITFDNAILDVAMLESHLTTHPEWFTLRPLVFIVNPQDEAALQVLRNQFPQGSLIFRESVTEGRNFYLYVVPAT